ncbi:MotA/TolQ/ExbB proton channel family protein [bacterium]|nr:MotA/TolQ/ExbB proton channel family protein [bacterium]
MSDLVWESWEYLKQGGWVMIPLGAASLWMWVLVLDRFAQYAAFTTGDIDAMSAVKALEDQDVDTSGSGLRRMLLNRFLNERSRDAELDRSILHQHTLALRPKIRQHLAMIAILAAIAPLLGLLGTVLGMMETFEVIAMFGTGNAKAMAGGISVALVTTQAGLLVAIPGMLVSGALLRRARRMELRLDEFSHLLDRTLKHQDPALSARS